MIRELISVIVPVYEVEAYLPTCIESIIEQTCSNLEIILVDDGSTDNSGRICDDYAKRDRRIHVIHKQNGGLVSARKAGMRIASGDLIAYVDSDDWVDRDMYERMLETMHSCNADMVVVGHTEEWGDRFYERKNEIGSGVYKDSRLVDELFAKMLYDPCLGRWSLSPACWDKLFKKNLVEPWQMKVNDKIWDGEDHAFTYPTILDCKCICIMDDLFYHHRVRNDSISVMPDQNAFERISYLYQGLKTAYEKSAYWEIIEKPFHFQMRWFLLKHMRYLLRIGVDDLVTVKRTVFLFPFDEVVKGSQIVLYGAGNVGKQFYDQIKKTEYCSVVLWVSEDHELRGENIHAPEEIMKIKYDAVVIAVSSKHMALEIREKLNKMGVKEEQIKWADSRL